VILLFFADMLKKLKDPVFAAKFGEVLQQQGEVASLLKANSANRGHVTPSMARASKAELEGFTIGRLIGELTTLYKKTSPSHDEVVRMHEILEALKKYLEPDTVVQVVEQLTGHKAKRGPLTGVYGYGNHKGGRRTRRAKRTRRGTRRN
jgi:hypothetical protein